MHRHMKLRKGKVIGYRPQDPGRKHQHGGLTSLRSTSLWSGMPSNFFASSTDKGAVELIECSSRNRFSSAHQRETVFGRSDSHLGPSLSAACRLKLEPPGTEKKQKGLGAQQRNGGVHGYFVSLVYQSCLAITANARKWAQRGWEQLGGSRRVAELTQNRSGSSRSTFFRCSWKAGTTQAPLLACLPDQSKPPSRALHLRKSVSRSVTGQTPKPCTSSA
jgi:hypothetical protein